MPNFFLKGENHIFPALLRHIDIREPQGFKQVEGILNLGCKEKWWVRGGTQEEMRGRWHTQTLGSKYEGLHNERKPNLWGRKRGWCTCGRQKNTSAVILEPPKIKSATGQSSNVVTLGWISLQVLMCTRQVAWNEGQVSIICRTLPHSSTKWTMSSHIQWLCGWKCWSHLKDEEAEAKNGQLPCQRPSQLGTVEVGIWT